VLLARCLPPLEIQMKLLSLLAVASILLPASALAAEDALVWAPNASGKVEAQLWQRPDGGQWSLSRVLPGLSLVGKGGLQELTSATVKVPSYDCECGRNVREDMTPEEFPTKCKKSVAVQIPAIRTRGKLVPLMKAPDHTSGEDGTADGPQAEVLGVVGPYVFVAVHHWTYYCGAAHGNAAAWFMVWDSDAGKTIALWDAAEEKGLARAMSIRALAYIQDEAGEDNQDEGEKTLKLSAIKAQWLEGKLAPSWLGTVDWVYAGGDSMWGSYTRSKWLDNGLVPKKLLPYKDLPEALVPLATAVPTALQLRLLVPTELAALNKSAPASKPTGGRPPAAGTKGR
jgi:hypothetical protein